MLIELQRLHGEILANLNELDRLTARAEPPMERLPAVRLALTRASRRRTMLLERLHQELLSRAGPANKAALETLRAEGKDNLVLSAQHIGTWTLRKITKCWPDYCAASKRMRAAMRERVALEIKVLYPLLSREQNASRAA